MGRHKSIIVVGPRGAEVRRPRGKLARGEALRQAALALSDLGRRELLLRGLPKALRVLKSLMNDEDPRIRLAAASGILRSAAPLLASPEARAGALDALRVAIEKRKPYGEGVQEEGHDDGHDDQGTEGAEGIPDRDEPNELVEPSP